MNGLDGLKRTGRTETDETDETDSVAGRGYGEASRKEKGEFLRWLI